MSLLPYMVDDLQDVPKIRPDMGWELQRCDWLHTPFHHLFNSLHPFGHTNRGYNKKSYIGKDGFQVCLDVKHFVPDDITVQVVDNFIIIDAQHEEKQDDHGYIFRHFQRRYRLPKEFNSEDVVSKISSDGILTVSAPRATEGSNIRLLQIQHIGPVRLNSVDKAEVAAANGVK